MDGSRKDMQGMQRLGLQKCDEAYKRIHEGDVINECEPIGHLGMDANKKRDMVMQMKQRIARMTHDKFQPCQQPQI